MEIWQVVLSSTLVSGIVSGSIAGWFSLRSKRDEYANAYYKLVLERRIAAYEAVEELILSIKTAVADDDRRLYHLLFSNDDDHANVYKKLHATNLVSLWLTDEMFSLTRELNLLVFSRTKESGLIEFGKKNYIAVAELRTKMERVHAADMIVLHDVPSFLKSKKPCDGYSPLPTSA